ncbi:thioredoxin domain-containing protein [Mucilaginibacter sabulilitoris]|uniref:Thioredoxin domain-containing protein n=1 Tax=Mucilaginibacter sabulilitoris TaxID=1173583 RepID=A0ABZ0TNQ2_9SPHI|nr:thioredoxin fold domain-containing protein [Mucilaginibacter sabulilitoris]WPU94766.1 thioredoxin domain-containing protein [Mucilaginibacter sabulilitoris]
MKYNKRFYVIIFIVGVAMVLGFQVSKVCCQDRKPKMTGITFTDKTWKEILSLARQQHKLIFLDAYADWCAPCKLLKERTFKDPAVGAQFNRQFINASVDVEKGEGLVLAEQYDITAYPTLLFLDSDGKVIFKSEGFVNADQLGAFAKSVVK